MFEFYPYLIEYVDYLIQQSKIDKLTLLWQFTNRLGQEEHQLLETRLKEIVQDTASFLKAG
jgi:hypothetical protein